MNLTHLTDKILLQDIKVLVKKEKDLSVSILYHLCEIDDRRLYAELKYSSLFDYCVNHLGYSEGAAQRRISASRLMKREPVVKKSLEEGTMNLSQASFMAGFLKNHPDEKTEELVKLAEESGSTQKFKDRLEERVKSENKEKKTRVTIMMTEEELKLLKELKRETGLGENELILKLLKEKKKEMEKKKFKDLKSSSKFKQDESVQLPKPNATKNSSEERVNKTPTKSIPSSVKRFVAQRANRKCENCQSTFRLEYHHLYPRSFGGNHEISNIKLLCKNCHARETIKQLPQRR